MKKIRCHGWQWQIRHPEMLDDWFERWPEIMKSNQVKKNPARTVFTVNERYFVKYFTPHGTFNRVIAFFNSKAKAEFKTGLALEKTGIPVVKYLGWGKQAGYSMLLSAAKNDASTAMQQWHRNPQQRPELLAKLAQLTRLLMISHWFHPDYHAGNLLYDNNSLCLVDVYGIKRIASFSRKQKLRMTAIILGLRQHINDDQAHKFILDSKIADNESAAAEIWRDALFRDGRRIDSDWEKRRRQILNNYPKFVEVRGNISLHRLADGSVPDLGNAVKEIYSSEIALKLWLRSFFLELQGIAHRKILAWENHDTIYLENLEILPEVDPVKAMEFINRATLLGVELTPENLVQLKTGAVILESII